MVGLARGMQNHNSYRVSGQSGFLGVGNGPPGDFYAVPTQNRFAHLPPVDEWVGYSMNLAPSSGQTEQMEVDMMRNKRRRFNTGQSDMLNNPNPNAELDAKLAFICEKLENLDRASQTMATITQNLTTVQTQVMCIENQTSEQNRFLKVLAYKSIDIEARSRRKNLLFHGLNEHKSEDCYQVLRDFLWAEMGLDSDDLGIERVHRIGSLHNARVKSDLPKRPIIASFYEYKHTNVVLETGYMLRNSNFSVSRDYPREIVSARKRLMPQFKSQRQNTRSKVSKCQVSG